MYKIMHPGQHKKTNLYFRGEYIGNNSIKWKRHAIIKVMAVVVLCGERKICSRRDSQEMSTESAVFYVLIWLGDT
jgi:hypothetical protein